MRVSGLACILYNIGKDNQTVRCDECYKVWRRNNIKENVRRFRVKSKNVTANKLNTIY